MNIKRLLRDIEVGRTNLAKLGIHICPDEGMLTDIHFLMPGPQGTPYAGGLYHGLLRLSHKHPMKPGSMYMFTPSGRFSVYSQPPAEHNKGICTTNTVYHEKDWTPLNTIEGILIGFQSFMAEDPEFGIGSIKKTDQVRKQLAAASLRALQHDAVACRMFADVLASLPPVPNSGSAAPSQQ